MKRIFFSFALLGMALYCPAQKIKHHEVAVGWYGGYFFTNPLNMHTLGLSNDKPSAFQSPSYVVFSNPLTPHPSVAP